MSEDRLIARLRALATHPAARGLMDDAAVLPVDAGALVFTHDMIVEGVHFLAADAPADVAWKLVAVNMSDLAAKGAAPLGVLMGYGMAQGDAWNAAFADGLGAALGHFGVLLLGGDTVRMPAGAPATFGLTAIGRAPACGAPNRSGAGVGDDLWVSGPIGDAGLGLALTHSGQSAPAGPIAAYRRPMADLALGQALASHVSAMMDVSDGLLIDAARMAEASGCAVEIALDAVPLSGDWRALRGDDLPARLAAATMGDDFCLLFTAPAERRAAITGLSPHIARVGQCAAGTGLMLKHNGTQVPLPERLGYLHR